MGDFTLDHFLTQLLRYLEANKDELEAMRPGVYAVARDKAGTAVQPGVIFFLLQRNAGEAGSRQRAASPVASFLLRVLARQRPHPLRLRQRTAGAVRVRRGDCRGKAMPSSNSATALNQETDQGHDMSRYEKLLTDAIAHIRQSHGIVQTRGLGSGRDFVLPKASESPNDNTDFELITWLVFKDTK